MQNYEADFLATAREFRKAVEAAEAAQSRLHQLKTKLRAAQTVGEHEKVFHHEVTGAEADLKRWQDLEDELRDNLIDSALVLPLDN